MYLNPTLFLSKFSLAFHYATGPHWSLSLSCVLFSILVIFTDSYYKFFTCSQFFTGSSLQSPSQEASWLCSLSWFIRKYSFSLSSFRSFSWPLGIPSPRRFPRALGFSCTLGFTNSLHSTLSLKIPPYHVAELHVSLIQKTWLFLSSVSHLQEALSIYNLLPRGSSANPDKIVLVLKKKKSLSSCWKSSWISLYEFSILLWTCLYDFTYIFKNCLWFCNQVCKTFQGWIISQNSSHGIVWL